MKKLLSILLLLSIILSMSACEKDKDDDVLPNVPENKVLDEYHAYIAARELPEFFVGYDDIAELGSLERYSINGRSEDYCLYNGLAFLVDYSEVFYGNFEHPMNDPDLLYMKDKEYRNLMREAYGVWFYYNEDGYLTEIAWNSNGCFYTFGFSRDYVKELKELENLGVDTSSLNPLVWYAKKHKDSIMSDFFHADTLPNAIQNFNEQVYGTQQP